MSTLQPGGPAAQSIAALWWVLLAGAVAIFALTMLLLALAFRRRGGEARDAADTPAEGTVDGAASPDARAERTWLAGFGLAFPITVLAALTVFGIIIGDRMLARPAPDLVTVSAEARQWEWRFGYADRPGTITQNVLHIPAGRPVDVQITTVDVIHSFWVPRLAGKLDAIPGHTNTLRIEADAPGEYAGASAEFSGTGYRGHVFTVIAHDAAGWDRFLAGDTP